MFLALNKTGGQPVLNGTKRNFSMYQKTLTIKLDEQSPLYQTLFAVAQQEGCTVDTLIEKISEHTLCHYLEVNLAFLLKHKYDRRPIEPLCNHIPKTFQQIKTEMLKGKSI